MTDQLPGRTPPEEPQAWNHPARPQPRPVRIGDAERDDAVNRLGDHFAAGRLTREEFDERSGTALGARFDTDLEPLFGDLPDASREVVSRRARPPARSGPPSAALLLVPLLVMAVVASIALHGPILLAPLVWLLVLSGPGHRHRYR